MVNVTIIGANGYSGLELIQILLRHPKIQIKMLVSQSHHGKTISQIYPHLQKITNKKLEKFDIDKISQVSQVVFFATPAGISKKLLPLCLKKGLICIDLSGDFRLNRVSLYQKWYGKKSASSKLLKKAVYGLSEINSSQIKKARFVANPGCFPTATLLALAPIIQTNIADISSIIIDGKSGISGAGQKTSFNNLFSQISQNTKPYKIGFHQHTPEIEQEIYQITGKKAPITFTPQIVPMVRGILITAYLNLKLDISTTEILKIYQNFYKKNYFIRIFPKGNWPQTKDVVASNFCDIGLFSDRRTHRLTIASTIDNLVKGAAGQAIQDLNLMKGWKEELGLKTMPIFP